MTERKTRDPQDPRREVELSVTAPARPSASDRLADELLEDGQEEVFSRSEVEQGRIEHHAGEQVDHRQAKR